MYIKPKLRKMIYVFSQIAYILNFEELKQMYYAFVQSLLQFGIIAWGGANKTILKPLITVQKTIIKSALRKPRRYSSDLLFQEMRVLDVKQLYVKAILMHTYHNRDNMFEAVGHRYGTRGSVLLGIK